MKDTKRAFRREHKNRMKIKAVKVRPYDQYAFKLADNLARCSCPSCGNPRHNGFNRIKETIPEYMHEIGMYEQVSELDNVHFKIKNRKKLKRCLY